jgi:hypothetical protein
VTPDQSPGIWTFDGRGKLVLARARPRPARSEPPRSVEAQPPETVPTPPPSTFAPLAREGNWRFQRELSHLWKVLRDGENVLRVIAVTVRRGDTARRNGIAAVTDARLLVVFDADAPGVLDVQDYAFESIQDVAVRGSDVVFLAGDSVVQAQAPPSDDPFDLGFAAGTSPPAAHARARALAQELIATASSSSLARPVRP